MVQRVTISKARKINVEIRQDLIKFLIRMQAQRTLAHGIFQAGRNLYPYTRCVPRWADPIAVVMQKMIVRMKDCCQK